jgi:cytochrome c peroxidase
MRVCCSWPALGCLWLGACSSEPEPLANPFETVEELGEALFHDENLSQNRTQACATCHDPERGFVDARLDEQGLVSAVSLGDDGASLGDRNAPTAAYAAFSPVFHFGERERHNNQNQNRLYEGALGGLFLDGREADLEGQAGGPFLNPLEMGMPDAAAVVARLREDTRYQAAFDEFFGQGVLSREEEAFAAVTESLAAYERTPTFAPFDSRYDRFLRGEVVLTFKELSGKSLFFSQFSNCGVCHQLHGEGDPVNERVEPFTGFEYHNLGVPVNEAVRAKNGVTDLDVGLASNPAVTEPAAERGKFKTPTLRNVAITGPYMHNGVFRELRTVLEFYDHFNAPEERPDNPETGQPWAPPEIPETVATELLEVGDPMTDVQIESMLCFLRALTDARYEALLDDSVDCAD